MKKKSINHVCIRSKANLSQWTTKSLVDQLVPSSVFNEDIPHPNYQCVKISVTDLDPRQIIKISLKNFSTSTNLKPNISKIMMKELQKSTKSLIYYEKLRMQ